MLKLSCKEVASDYISASDNGENGEVNIKIANFTKRGACTSSYLYLSVEDKIKLGKYLLYGEV